MSIENVVRFIRDFFKQRIMNTETAIDIAENNNYNSGGSDGGVNSDSSVDIVAVNTIDDDSQSTYNTIVEFGLKDNVSISFKCVTNAHFPFRSQQIFFFNHCLRFLTGLGLVCIAAKDSIQQNKQ